MVWKVYRKKDGLVHVNNKIGHSGDPNRNNIKGYTSWFYTESYIIK